ncbi:MAG: hypothetical protein MJZ81_03525 [Bacteroidales bacterium]|nr:hypothetical protein [Bacteroidales bacterium]
MSVLSNVGQGGWMGDSLRVFFGFFYIYEQQEGQKVELDANFFSKKSCVCSFGRL